MQTLVKEQRVSACAEVTARYQHKHVKICKDMLTAAKRAEHQYTCTQPLHALLTKSPLPIWLHMNTTVTDVNQATALHKATQLHPTACSRVTSFTKSCSAVETQTLDCENTHLSKSEGSSRQPPHDSRAPYKGVLVLR
jgi:hypothetical protein